MASDKTRHTLYLTAGDVATLQEAFPAVGASYVIRELVHRFVCRLDSDISLDAFIEEVMTNADNHSGANGS